MNNCYNCGEILEGENVSDEHILLNSIGGRYRSKKLLCKNCNSKFGADCDAELGEQLLFLTSHLQVKKHRGDIAPIKGGINEDGEVYTIVNGSKPVMAKPVYEEAVEGDKTIINIQAQNEAQLRKMLEGLARKYPGFDVEDAISKSKRVKEYLQKPLQYRQTFGGEKAFRAMAKSAVGFYLETGGNKDIIDHVIPFLRGEISLDIVFHYNPEILPYIEADDEVLHILHLVGDKENSLLYCYVQFFSAYSYLVLLSDNYIGDNFTKSYAYDVLLNEIKDKKLSVTISRQDFERFKDRNLILNGAAVVQKKMQRVLGIASKRHHEQTRSDIISETIDEILTKKYGYVEVITEEMADEVSKTLAEEIVKYLYRINTVE